MDSQSASRDRKSFDKISEGAKKPTSLLRLPCSVDREALDDLFASNSSHLYKAAFRILSNPHDAEDAVQDSLLCAFRNLNQFHGRARFSPWLHRIAINSSLMRLRKRNCRRDFPLEPVFTGEELVAPGIDPRSGDPNPEEQCARVEQRKILLEALLKLPGLLRTAVELCDLEGLPTKDAAQRLGVPLSTMKARLFRSRRALKTTILQGRSARPLFRTADKNARWHRPQKHGSKDGIASCCVTVALPKSIPGLMEAIIQERAIHCQRSAAMKRPSMLDWYLILRVHCHFMMFQAVRYALWFTR